MPTSTYLLSNGLVRNISSGLRSFEVLDLTIRHHQSTHAQEYSCTTD
jgi:hypothetical protein